MRRFVILAARRTGSNLLCTLLDSHPEIVCHHELFNPRGIHLALDHRDGSFDLGTPAERDRDPPGFLRRLWSSAPGAACLGFKMTPEQSQEALECVLADAGVTKILLRRENRLRTYVSECIARSTERWEAYRPADLPAERPRIRVELGALVEHARANAEFYAGLEQRLAASAQGWIALRYEELLEHAAQRRLLERLGVRAAARPLVARSIAQNPGDLALLVEDWEGLGRTLAGTPFEVDLARSSA